MSSSELGWEITVVTSSGTLTAISATKPSVWQAYADGRGAGNMGHHLAIGEEEGSPLIVASLKELAGYSIKEIRPIAV